MNEVNQIKKLSERDHIRQRPAMYIGATDITKTMEYILEDGKIVYKEVQYVPGLIKVINEIIDNSVDVAIKTNFKFSDSISVKIEDNRVIVEDNGSGIPVLKNSEGHYLPELCWNHARAGSNFNDDENRTQIGMNGVGSYATACFSTMFKGTTDDGKNRYEIKIINGAESFTERLLTSSKQGTKVEFDPDLSMFGVDSIDEIHSSIIHQRLINLSISFPKISFKFNGKTINTNTFKKYVQMFSGEYEIYETEKYKFAILPNSEDDFKQFSYVNGLKIPDGGMHIDVISYNIVSGIREKLIKKYKEIKPGDIKNKLMVVAFLTDFKNPKFNSQAKEKITNSIKEMNEYFGEIPYETIINKVLKNSSIIDPITEVYRIKEEFAKRQALKNADKKTKKKPKSEKFMPPIGPWKRCFVCEGDSAANSMSKLLGRDGKGYYAMFGVPPNAYSAPISDIIKSVKMMELKDILGLKFSETIQDDINFDEIIITTDYDLPGHFIAGQLIGMLYRFGKNLFEEKRIRRLVTPLMLATDKKEKIVAWFYTFNDYKEFQEKNKDKNYNYDYKKGLGSWDPEELDIILNADGLENMLEVFTLDEEGIERIEDWLGNETQKRKDQLEGVKFDMMTV